MVRNELRRFGRVLTLILVAAIFPAIGHDAFAASDDFLLGTWTETGPDIFDAPPLNFRINKNGHQTTNVSPLTILPYGTTQYAVVPNHFIAQFLFGGGLECNYQAYNPIFLITPSDSDPLSLSSEAKYAFQVGCVDVTLTTRQATITSVAPNHNSFTLCGMLTGLCSTWTRVGKPLSVGKTCSPKLVPAKPKLVKDDGVFIFLAGAGYGNASGYTLTLSGPPYGNRKSNIKAILPAFPNLGFGPGSDFHAQIRVSCGPDGKTKSKLGKALTFNVK